MSHANWLEGRAWAAAVALLGLCGLLVALSQFSSEAIWGMLSPCNL